MAVVIIRLRSNGQRGDGRQTGGTKTKAAAAQTGGKAYKSAAAQPQTQYVEQRAASMPVPTATSAPTSPQQQAEEKSYLTAFALIGFIGGIYLISQYK